MSHRRQKQIRQLCKWVFAARQAGRQSDLEKFVDHLISMRATQAEIKRAVSVLLKTKQVRHAKAPKDSVLAFKPQVDPMGVGQDVPGPGVGLSEVRQPEVSAVSGDSGEV